MLGKKLVITSVLTVVATLVTVVLRAVGADSVAVFILSAIALAGLA